MFRVHEPIRYPFANRIEANGSITVGFGISYKLWGGGSEAIVNVVASITDDNGVNVGGTVQVLIK